MFWDLVLNPVFLITTGLVLGAFGPLLWSIVVTWDENSSRRPHS